MRFSEIESSVQNISTHPSLESRVPRIAIVGAGLVGSTTANALMMSGMAAEIVLIGRDSRRAEGHVNDLRDAEVFSHTTRITAGDFSDCCSADVTIITAGVGQSGQKSRMEGLRETGTILHGLINDVCLQNPRGILLIASNPAAVLTYAAWKWPPILSNRHFKNISPRFRATVVLLHEVTLALADAQVCVFNFARGETKEMAQRRTS